MKILSARVSRVLERECFAWFQVQRSENLPLWKKLLSRLSSDTRVFAVLVIFFDIILLRSSYFVGL